MKFKKVFIFIMVSAIIGFIVIVSLFQREPFLGYLLKKISTIGYGTRYDKCDIEDIRQVLINSYKTNDATFKIRRKDDYRIYGKIKMKETLNIFIILYKSDIASKLSMRYILSRGDSFSGHYPGTYTGSKIGEEAIIFMPPKIVKDRRISHKALRVRSKNLHVKGYINMPDEQRLKDHFNEMEYHKLTINIMEYELIKILKIIDNACLCEQKNKD